MGDRAISELYVFFWLFCGILMLYALWRIGSGLARISNRLDRIANALERDGAGLPERDREQQSS